ncbi:glycoside hydrolase family 43 protein [Sphingomonas sp. R647]|uniref:glycoside hydrolase family 43 protein n=1 Tax=Sphingomonas sp. R647 TaxID=2875233 RepID=UPI001CD2A21E|nr:glycoside hydrolase family 43 protein [Sphingomonas sp. R647]MCA1196557.1 glycoside hydrolase family 43 protein [Sphingomonas sp. R647]
MAKYGFLAVLALTCTAFAPAKDDAPFAPVLEEDFADPFVMLHDRTFYAYATNPPGNVANVQMATSTNLADWALVKTGGKIHDAMPTLPVWAREGFTWAPEVQRVANGFVIYITAREKETGLQCIGAAFASDPRGPFVSKETEPMVCQRDLGGTIDAAPFRDTDGTLYLYYKNDGNNPKFGKPTDIYAQKMSADGLKLEGPAVALLRNDKPWEAHVIEAPTMVKTPTGYAMFYSSNHYGWETHQRLSPYAMGWAKCDGPMGPCTDAPKNPILYSYNNREAGCLSGPGHQSIFNVGARQFVSFHAWAATPGCRKLDNKRYLYVAPLLWKDGEPAVGVSIRPSAKK